MIAKLQKRFVRIAMLSVLLVMLLLSVIVDVTSLVSTNSRLNEVLSFIAENQGSFPSQQRGEHPEGERPGRRPNDPINIETPFSTRFFVLHYNDAGELEDADLNSIAAVTEENVDHYLSIALKHGEGYGYVSGYKYLVVHTGEDRNMAVFLDCYQDLLSIKGQLTGSAAAIVFCTLMTYVLLRLFSRRAIDPVVRSAEQQKQFITDAGHELKTPLTVITTCLSVLEMETGKNKWIDKIQAQTDKMRDLVNDLVTLSRMDEERPPVIMADFDISAAVAETAESFADSAQAAGLTLEQDIESGLSYHGDEAQIRQLCSILLDNAMKYALDSAPVRIGLKKEKAGVVLRCLNACAELPQEELNKLFDRFYRPDKSRSSETGGFGIGLSIARSIAQAHKGTIKAAAPQPGIIEFTAVLK